MAEQGNVTDDGEVEFWDSCPLCRSESELGAEARAFMRWLEAAHQWPVADCPSCRGRGEVHSYEPDGSGHTFSEICARCDGSGIVAPCPVCKDIGTIPPDRLVELRLMYDNAKGARASGG